MINLKFHSPSLLNSLNDTSTEEPKEWHILSSGDDMKMAVLNLETMSIQEEGNNEQSAFLKEMFVNEDKNLFYFEQFDNSSKLDFPFASSMLGQLLVGKEFIDALKRLNEHYGAERVNDEEPISDNQNKEELDKEV